VRTAPEPAVIPVTAHELTVELVGDIAEIDAAAWNACANPSGVPFNPFIAHDFLAALETSGSVSRRTGWAARHLVMRERSGGMVGAVPLYLKSHSQGEYVFDHGWAEAFQRAGGRYYPKLQGSVPFTPATGRRLLVRGDRPARDTARQLAEGLIQVTDKLGVSSLHLTFMPKEEWAVLGECGFLQRTDRQFHWLNKGYQSFDEFLGELASRKRKTLRRERAEALADGVTVEWVTGRDLSEAHWDAFFEFYMETGSRKWGRPYLNRLFFSLVGERMADHILLVLCRRSGRHIAGALNFIGGDTLYGRYWGAVEDHPFLHFETCYYQAIDFAIARGLAKVEAGAQGPHKLARGYLPTATYSAHYIPNPAFRDAVERYLCGERQYVAEEIEAMRDLMPFRRGEQSGS